LANHERLLMEIIKDYIANQHGVNESQLANMSIETHLFEEGLLDSTGFVALLAHMSDKTQIEIDFMNLDPSALTTPASLIELYQPDQE